MTITVNLVDDSLPVIVDDRTADLGGSFYYEPLRVYSAYPHRWAWQQLQRLERAVLIDVGSSTGCYPLLAAHHPGLTVYAFEPVPKSTEVLRANIELNNLGNRVHSFECGVSNYNGMGIVHCVYPEGGSGVSMVDGIPREDKKSNDYPVKVITLDAFCKALDIVPTLLKVDTEGGEKLVLEGARETIETYHPMLIVEYEPLNTSQYGYPVTDLSAMLDAWGYEYSNPENNDLLALWKGNL